MIVVSFGIKKIEGLLNCTDQINKYIIFKAKLAGDNINMERSLRNCIRAHDYDTMSLPILEDENFSKFEINYKFSILRLIDLENDGRLTMSATFQFTWKDKILQWDPYFMPALQTSILLPVEDIWHPEFILANCIDFDNCIISPAGEKVKVYHSGVVWLRFIRIISSKCTMKFDKFPFDTQVCEISFFLKDYSNDLVLMVPPEPSFMTDPYLFSHVEWELVGGTLYNSDLSYSAINIDLTDYLGNSGISNGNANFTGFAMQVTYTRGPANYLTTVVFPLLTISFTSFFTVFLPVGSGDKLNLGVTVFLGYIFMLTFVSSIIPKVETPPYLAMFVLASIILTTVNLMGIVILIGIYNLPAEKEPPLYIKAVGIRFLGCLVCRSCPCCDRKNKVDDKVNLEKENGLVLPNKDEKDAESEENKETWQEFATNLNRLFSVLYLIAMIVMITLFIIGISSS